MRRLLTVLLILATIALCASCMWLARSMSLRKTLPGDWPIPQLTFSGDVSLTGASKHGAKMPSAEGEGWQTWMAFIHCDDGMQKAAAGIESCLAPLAYQRVAEGAPGEDETGDFMREYYSADGRTEVSISEDPTRGMTASRAEMQAELSERESALKAGASVGSTKATDFMVMVMIYEKPSSSYSAIASGKLRNVRLEPLAQQ